MKKKIQKCKHCDAVANCRHQVCSCCGYCTKCGQPMNVGPHVIPIFIPVQPIPATPQPVWPGPIYIGGTGDSLPNPAQVFCLN
jgi:hypothetical protein